MVRLRLVLLVAVLLAAGCSPRDPSLPSQVSSVGDVHVTRQEYGEKWPLTVDSGKLRNMGGAVIFESDTDHRIYAVNGTAKSQGGWSDIEPIRALDSGERGKAGYKKKLDPLIDRGLQLPP